MRPVLIVLLVSFLLLDGSLLFSQPSVGKMKLKIDADGISSSIQMTTINQTQAGLLFTNSNLVSGGNEISWLSNQLELRSGIDALVLDGDGTTTGNLLVKQYHQYFKGIKVEHGVIKNTLKNGAVAMMQLEFYAIDDAFAISPALTEAQALQKAIEFTGAKKYMWEDYTGSDPAYQLPKGELVIMQTYLHEGEMCMAYKFNVYASQPLSRTLLYVDAATGRIVLDDEVIKHANVPGTADTHYSGTQAVVTDNGSGVSGKPYWLYQLRNGHEIRTLNYRKFYSGQSGHIVTKFVDNDNNWSGSEFDNADADDAALDVHFNMQIVSDYWKQVHNRNGWDDKNSELLSYVHVKEYVEVGSLAYSLPMDNAFWSGTEMYFGDGRNGAALPSGTGSALFNSVTSLDVTAHEVGHAICQSTAALVYRWESGALNEGFSDIWGACIENFGINNNASISPNKSVWKIGEEITINYLFGLRDMSDPDSHNDPSTFKGPHWRPAEFQNCRVPGSRTNDDCGVHYNSNVLNKWFFLITQGEAGINTKGTPYGVAGMGFNSSQKIAYLTELNLPPNSSYATAKTVSINAATTLFGAASFETQSVKAAWIAVGVDTCIYDMSNTPAFITNNFISIGVGAFGNIWAGTINNGLYRYNDTTWSKRSEIPKVRINDIKADKAGGIWIAQSGTVGTAAIAGGVNYIPNPYTGVTNFYTVSTQTQVPSRNARCIYVDTNRVNDGSNPAVWVATQSYLLNGNSESGMLGQGLYSNYKQFHPVSDSLNINSNTVSVTTVGGYAAQVWGFTPSNYGSSQLLSYNATTNAFIRSYDHNSVPQLPASFVGRAIFFDAMHRAWVGLASGGVMVFDEHQVWHNIHFPSLFPLVAGIPAAVNPNAITGDPYGDVYIGTTAGLVFFDHGIGQSSRIDSVDYYHLYNNTNGIPSSNISAIAYDTGRFKLLIATDQGIVFWEPPCLGTSCDIVRTNLATQASSTGAGNWSNPAIWSNGKVPDSATYVVLQHPVTVDVNAACRSLSVAGGGAVHLNAGINFTVIETPGEIKPVGVRRRRTTISN
ncbi:MAG: M4 family metallopeptidase [Chitinophagaceae bacterium]